MAINSIPSNHDFSNITALKSSASDTSSKTLQNQLTNTEQRLNRLSSDSKISAAEKAKERQKLQKQIAELNRKLRLLQLKKEEEQEKAQKEKEQKAALQEEMLSDAVSKNSSVHETLTDTHRTEEISKETPEAEKKAQAMEKETEKPKPDVISSQDVQKMLVASSTLQKNRIQNQVIHQKENTEHILQNEIKMDEIHGNVNTFKQKELEALQSKPAFEIEALNAPKQTSHNTLGISDKTKIIVVE